MAQTIDEKQVEIIMQPEVLLQIHRDMLLLEGEEYEDESEAYWQNAERLGHPYC